MAWQRWIQLIPLRARSLFRRRRVEADLEEELRFHLAMTTSRYTRDGVSTGEAERRARRDFGGVDQAKEACRDALRMGVIDDIVHDVRYAIRSFGRSPAFTLVALVSVAIAVGVNCAAFSWADTLLLRPLPIARPSEVVTVGSKLNIEGAGIGPSLLRASYPEYVDLCERSRSFDGLAAYTGVTAGLAATAGVTPMLAVGDLVSDNFFSVLGVEPMLGRAFRREEGAVPGRDAVVILGHELWERQFGGDPAVVGRQVHLDGIAFTVVGVLPAWFTGVEPPLRPDFYAPIMMWPRLRPDDGVQPLEARDLRYITIKARLKGGADLEQAQTELALISHDVQRDHPESERGRAFAARTERQNRIAELPPLLMLNVLLMTLAAAVLLVACANVAGLLTSRAPVRAREMATRLALGAGRGRLIRQLLTESILLAIAGGASGLAAAAITVRAFQLIQFPTDMPFGYTFQFDDRAAVFGLAIALGSILLFGLLPAMHTSRVEPMTVMRGTELTIGRRRSWGRGLLVVGQVAVSVVLLVIASFIDRAFRLELTSGPGYRIDHLLMMTFDPGLVHYSDTDALRFYDTLVERARAVPQVKSVALASSVPMQTFSLNASTIVPEGYQLPPDKENVFVLSAVVDERYFETMRIRVVRGRGFRVEDKASAPRVAVVNEVMARHYWPDQDPIGKRFRLIDERKGSFRVEVVGVAKTSKYVFLAEPPTDYVYFPFRQGPPGRMILLAESEGDPATLVAPLRRMAKTIDAQQPIYNVRTMEEFYQVSTVGIFTAVIRTVATMGVMGLGLALVGLYGLVAYAAGRRTKEIGIRIAIGADRGAVLRMVLRQGVWLAVAGLAAGLVASVVAGMLLQRAFPGGDSRSDVASFAIVALTVLVVTLLAAYIPARRASRIDPMTAIRYE